MGDAGCIVTNREDVSEFSKLFARHGGKGEHKIEGINSRMDGLQAAILSVKLAYIDDWNQKRRNAALEYDKLLASLKQVSTPIVNDTNEHVFHLYVDQMQVSRRITQIFKSAWNFNQFELPQSTTLLPSV